MQFMTNFEASKRMTVDFNEPKWFINHVDAFANRYRQKRIIERNSYLAGEHEIKSKPTLIFNGKEIETKRLMVEIANFVNEFHTSYLLDGSVKVAGEKEIAATYGKVYNRGDFHSANMKVMQYLSRHGEAYEYTYIEDGIIKTHVFKPEYSFPVYNRFNQMEAFVYCYPYDGKLYYDVYHKERVEQYEVKDNGMKLLSVKYNASKVLPYEYKQEAFTEDGIIRPDTDKIIPLIDEFESSLSKNADAIYKHLMGIMHVDGALLDTPPEMSKDTTGFVIQTNYGGKVEYVMNAHLTQPLNDLFRILIESVCQATMTPVIALGISKIENISEETMRELYKNADSKAEANKRYLRNGFNQRHKAIRNLLELQGQLFSDDEFYSLKTVFKTNRPNSNKADAEIKQMYYEMGAISRETLVNTNPFVDNAKVEMERLLAEERGREGEQEKSNVNVEEKLEGSVLVEKTNVDETRKSE